MIPSEMMMEISQASDGYVFYLGLIIFEMIGYLRQKSLHFLFLILVFFVVG